MVSTHIAFAKPAPRGELTRPGSWHGGHGGEYVDIAKAFRRPEVMVGGGHLMVT